MQRITAVSTDAELDYSFSSEHTIINFLMLDCCCLRKYSHITAKLILLWGTEEFDPYLDSVIFSHRELCREGLPENFLFMLSNIQQLHGEIFDNNEENSGNDKLDYLHSEPRLSTKRCGKGCCLLHREDPRVDDL